MILDIIIMVILIVPMAIGLYRGFVYIFVHALGWIGSLVAAFFLTEPVAGILRNGFFGEMIAGGVSDKLYASGGIFDAESGAIPKIISGGLKFAEDSASDILAEMITTMIISVISFLLIVFVIRMILGVIVKPAARRQDRSFLTGADKLLGLIAGFIEGSLLVFVFLTLLIPVVNLSSGSAAAAIIDSLESSLIAGTLYDNNLLLVITGGMFN